MNSQQIIQILKKEFNVEYNSDVIEKLSEFTIRVSHELMETMEVIQKNQSKRALRKEDVRWIMDDLRTNDSEAMILKKLENHHARDFPFEDPEKEKDKEIYKAYLPMKNQQNLRRNAQLAVKEEIDNAVITAQLLYSSLLISLNNRNKKERRIYNYQDQSQNNLSKFKITKKVNISRFSLMRKMKKNKQKRRISPKLLNLKCDIINSLIIIVQKWSEVFQICRQIEKAQLQKQNYFKNILINLINQLAIIIYFSSLKLIYKQQSYVFISLQAKQLAYINKILSFQYIQLRKLTEQLLKFIIGYFIIKTFTILQMIIAEFKKGYQIYKIYLQCY
ncbi:transmembrane protein, putative (macronuclear) [Tetrahymena thermophila SB210]|uniref:Transmembrane protein, putative n=1 Tax=Tetrahymena thermophila (strain SB210) TaxID=312017 RepID=W7X990_TETTS|nr:transmembrane protein, putative [Tetrahymena thermophila SB210]EWS75960.1 transmembrane protein, putative [Tetrahymena thermophila SB210]|eukprot:XP_012651478.1 transmembrane protein, putative [Tetrahymena thermophila SB210]